MTSRRRASLDAGLEPVPCVTTCDHPAGFGSLTPRRDRHVRPMDAGAIPSYSTARWIGPRRTGLGRTLMETSSRGRWRRWPARRPGERSRRCVPGGRAPPTWLDAVRDEPAILPACWRHSRLCDRVWPAELHPATSMAMWFTRLCRRPRRSRTIQLDEVSSVTTCDVQAATHV